MSSAPPNRADRLDSTPPERDPRALLEDLRIHQVELELQAQALRASEELAQAQARQYQHLLAEVPVALLRLDGRGRIRGLNREAERLFGKPSVSLEGHYLFRMGATEGDRRGLLEALGVGLTRDRFVSTQHRCTLGDEHRVLDLHMSRVPSHHDRGDEWLLSLVDQTQVAREQTQLQTALAELRQALELNRDLATVTSRMPGLVAICDADEQPLWVNPRFTEVTGWSALQLQRRRLLNAIVVSQPGQVAQEDAERLRVAWSSPDGVNRQRMQLSTASGQPFWGDVSLLTVLDGQGLPARRIFIADDVTDQVHMQAERETVLKQQTLHTVQSDFLSRMSHNMRTPLNAILGFSQLLSLSLKDRLSDEDTQRLRILQEAGEQLLCMVDQALTLVRADYQSQHYELSSIDLGQIVAGAQLLLADRAAARRVSVQADVAPGHWVQGHAQLLQEIVSNLLSNAIKYSFEGQRVAVHGERLPDGQVALHVTDQGIGIAASELPLLFKPFSRLDAGRRMAAGHGLGLAISAQQAQWMAGRIEVRSREGLGSTFTLVLPAAPPPVDDAGPEERTHDVLASMPPLVMVYVEDDLINQTLVSAAMQMCPQVRLHLAGTVAEGRAVIERHRPDVVLLDINLPDGTGTDLCRQLCADPGTRPPLILALSADAMPEQVRQAMDAGFDHYLAKPVEFDQLFNTMARVCPQDRTRA